MHISLEAVNLAGQYFCSHAQSMFIQIFVLVSVLLVLDLLIRKLPFISSYFRYGLWMLVLFKLILPPSFSLPTGLVHRIDFEQASVIGETISPASSGAVPQFVATEALPVEQAEKSTHDVEPFASTEFPLASVRMTGILFLVWLGIVCWMLMLLIVRYFKMRIDVHRSQPAPEWLSEKLKQSRKKIKVRKRVRIRLCSKVSGPVLFGIHRPVLLLPPSLPDDLSGERLETILCHELVHVKRRDTLMNLLQSLLQILYFYHPMVWVANHMTRRVRELAVDQTVLGAARVQPSHYSETLIQVAEMAYRRPEPVVCFAGLPESKKILKERIVHMLKRRAPRRVSLSWRGLIVVVAIGALLVPMGRGAAEDASKQDPVVAEEVIQVPQVPEKPQIPESLQVPEEPQVPKPAVQVQPVAEPSPQSKPHSEPNRGFFSRLNPMNWFGDGNKKQREVRHFEESCPMAAGLELKATSSFGRIKVFGSDDETCKVNAAVRVEARSTERAREIADQVALELVPDGKRLLVRLKKPRLRNNESVGADLDIVVPRQVDVDTKTSFGKMHLKDLSGHLKAETSFGKVQVEDLSGSIYVKTSFGAIQANRISGNSIKMDTSYDAINAHALVSDNLDLTTSFGAIDFDLNTSSKAPAKIRATTSYGNIKAAVPASFAGKLNAKTSFGSVNCALPVTIKGKVKKDRVVGKIGEGDGLLDLETSFGNIRINAQ